MCSALLVFNLLNNNEFVININKLEIITFLRHFIIPLSTILFHHEIGSLITEAENYMPHFQISSGAPCALPSLFTSVQYCLEMLVHYLVMLYKPVQQSQTHNNDFTAYPQVNAFMSSDGSMSTSGSAGLGFDPQRGSKFSF